MIMEYNTSKQSIMIWNREFWVKDKFENLFTIESLEPKLFRFSESKNKIIKFCSDGVKNGFSSSEALKNKITTVISPYCYNSLAIEAGDGVQLVPSFIDLMFNLDSRTICISTVWRWMMVL